MHLNTDEIPPKEANLAPLTAATPSTHWRQPTLPLLTYMEHWHNHLDRMALMFYRDGKSQRAWQYDGESDCLHYALVVLKGFNVDVMQPVHLSALIDSNKDRRHTFFTTLQSLNRKKSREYCSTVGLFMATGTLDMIYTKFHQGGDVWLEFIAPPKKD